MVPKVDKFCFAQTNSTAVQKVNGKMVTMLMFEQSFEHHVYFVCETYNDYASLTRCRREGCRANLASQCTVTQLQGRLLEVMSELEDEEKIIAFIEKFVDVSGSLFDHPQPPTPTPPIG